MKDGDGGESKLLLSHSHNRRRICFFWLPITGMRRHSVNVFVPLVPPLTALTFYQTLMSSFKVDAHCRPVRAASNTQSYYPVA